MLPVIDYIRFRIETVNDAVFEVNIPKLFPQSIAFREQSPLRWVTFTSLLLVPERRNSFRQEPCVVDCEM